MGSGEYRGGPPASETEPLWPSVTVPPSLTGSNGHEFVFLLKGHEDLRQDERVMQLFGLVNTLLANDPTSLRKNLRYSGGRENGTDLRNVFVTSHTPSVVRYFDQKRYKMRSLTGSQKSQGVKEKSSPGFKGLSWEKPILTCTGSRKQHLVAVRWEIPKSDVLEPLWADSRPALPTPVRCDSSFS